MTTQRDARIRVASAIASYWREHGRAPSFDDVGKRAGYRSRGSLYGLVMKMRREGLVLYTPGTRRTLRLTQLAQGYVYE